MKVFINGENLRVIRQTKGLSQEVMASLLKISQAKYSRIERDKVAPNYKLVCAIAEILEAPVSELMVPVAALEVPAFGSLQTNRPGFMVSAREFLLGNMGIVILITVGYFFVNIIFEAAKGASSGLGASDATMMKVGFIAAFIATVVILYMIIRNRRKYRK